MNTIKRRITFLIAALTIATSAAVAADSNSPVGVASGNQSLVAKINMVTVLKFESDKPISEIRLVLDGKQVGRTTKVQTNSKELYLAVVPLNDSLDINGCSGGGNLLINADWPREYNVGIHETERYGPSKILVLNDWVEIYGITRYNAKFDIAHPNEPEKVVRTLKIEAR